MLSDKQRQQIELLETLRHTYGINLHVNVPLPEIKEPVSLDIEHDESGGFVGIGLFLGSTNSHYWFSDPVSLDSGDLCSLSLIGHNLISDLETLRFWGFKVADTQIVHDTMLIGHVLDSSLKAYGLKDMSKRHLNIEYPEYDEIVGPHRRKSKTRPACPRTASDCCGRITLDKQPPKLVQLYNCFDCFVPYKLYELQTKGQGAHGSALETPEARYFNAVEKPLAPILNDMSVRGIRVDLAYLRGLKSNLEAQQAPIKDEILNELGPINLNSPKQLLETLNAKGIFPTLKGKPSTDKRAIASLGRFPVVGYLLQYSELETLLSSFVYPYLERGTDYVHPFFNQVGTRTGRLSCSNPNLLQIPKHSENGKLVRRMFIPRDGFTLGDADYGQIEPRILAHFSKDPNLCEVFNSGQNFHTFTQQRMGFSLDDAGYKRAKILNLSVGYRATFKSVGQQLRCSDEEAQAEINKWWNLFPTLRRWQDKLIFDSKRSGYCTTLLGRRIKIEGLDHGNQWKREAAERQLINNIAQASAREVMAMGMIKVNRLIGDDCGFSPTFGLLIQVYDDLVFESQEIDYDKKLVVSCMETAVKLDVPLTVDCKTGPNWSEVC